MHLLELFTISLRAYQNRREHERYARRCSHDITKEAECFGRPNLGDTAHIPNRCALSIKVGRRDKQSSALSGFLGDGRQSLLADIASNKLPQSGIAEQPCPKQYVQKIGAVDESFRYAACIDFLQHVIVVRSKES